MTWNFSSKIYCKCVCFPRKDTNRLRKSLNSTFEFHVRVSGKGLLLYGFPVLLGGGIMGRFLKYVKLDVGGWFGVGEWFEIDWIFWSCGTTGWLSLFYTTCYWTEDWYITLLDGLFDRTPWTLLLESWWKCGSFGEMAFANPDFLLPLLMVVLLVLTASVICLT